MAIQYPAILERRPAAQEWSFSDRDAIIYALCTGFGADPCDRHTLPFLYEKNLKVAPTFPTVLAWIAEPTFTALGADPLTALHAAQKIELHGDIRMPLAVRVQGRVVEVYDKGPGRGAIVVSCHEICDAASGDKIATLTTTCFARGEGGCGGSSAQPQKPHEHPERPPDRSIDVATSLDSALLYRLTGDRNPLHADLQIARAAGFDRPILHGLCSFGICCRALLEAYADFDPARIASQEARFTAPVFPGETLTVDLWLDAEAVSFEARIQSRAVTVIKNGRALLRLHA